MICCPVEMKVKNLVVDTSAFIKGVNLQNVGENIFTIQEVIDEVSSKRQLRSLAALPYELKVKQVFSENIKFVNNFSKKTGDYRSLSATDIKVIALVYQLEKEINGSDHLKSEPVIQRTLKVTGLNTVTRHNANVIDSNTYKADECLQMNPTNSRKKIISFDSIPEDGLNETSVTLTDTLGALSIKGEAQDDTNASEDENSESDDEDWITPENIKEKTKAMDMGIYAEFPADVACITLDFAMQNVLKQIGLNITSLDGKIIKQVRTFIFRCTTCFKLTSVMTKVFCPNCGHASLRKVAVSIDENGHQQIHINAKKPLSGRGKKFSLPTPKGGQHFQYPILTEDQHIHKRHATRLAKTKTNPLDPDYIAGYSPFVMRDVNSKSAVLGIRHHQDLKHFMKANKQKKRK